VWPLLDAPGYADFIGWPLGVTRRAIVALDTADLGDGLRVMGDVTFNTDEGGVPEPVVTLLPALDPTQMGWKQRGRFMPEDPTGLSDRMGNVGPTARS
jgi:hypothetical protein